MIHVVVRGTHFLRAGPLSPDLISSLAVPLTASSLKRMLAFASDLVQPPRNYTIDSPWIRPPNCIQSLTTATQAVVCAHTRWTSRMRPEVRPT